MINIENKLRKLEELGNTIRKEVDNISEEINEIEARLNKIPLKVDEIEIYIATEPYESHKFIWKWHGSQQRILYENYHTETEVRLTKPFGETTIMVRKKWYKHLHDIVSEIEKEILKQYA